MIQCLGFECFDESPFHIFVRYQILVAIISVDLLVEEWR